MRVLVIEDEALAAEKLVNTLKAVEKESIILSVIDSVDGSIEWLKNNDMPDLILSDIHLSDGICFNIFSNVVVSCPIIFTTAYEKYAIQAFEVNSIDYLLKPVQEERLSQALDKYRNLNKSHVRDKSGIYEEFKSLLSQATKEYKVRFLCKIGNKIKSIPVSRIKYFYSKDKLTFIVDDANNRSPVNNTLDEIDQMIDPSLFFRVNRQFITHFDAISEIHPYFKGRLKINLDPAVEEDIIVSAERSPMFKSWLDR